MLAEVQARLEDQVAAFKGIDDAAGFAQVSAKPASSPMAFVVPVADQAGPNRTAPIVSQELIERFGVVIATSNRRERHGGAAARDIESLVGAVRTALVGWSPDAGHDPVEYAAGRMMQADQGFVWWLCEFTTRSELRSAS